MAYRKREKPYNLLVLESLNNRTKLTKKNYADYLNAVKGYEGECCFDTFTDKLKDCLVLHDLPLKTNGVAYQIDTVLITKETIRLYEVKNYEGEFIYREESLYKINSKLEIINPLYRLTRSKLLFKQLLKGLGYGHFSVEAYIVFINPNFTLYEAPHLPNLLLLSNLEQHFKQIDAGLVPLKNDHQLLASKLCAQINPDNLDYNLPEYGYDSLEKGTSCLKCGRFIGKTVDKYYTCKSCGHQEPSNTAIFRHIQEYQRLFPTQKVTVSMIYDWCGRVPSRNRIRSVLQSRFQQKSLGRGVYYV